MAGRNYFNKQIVLLIVLWNFIVRPGETLGSVYLDPLREARSDEVEVLSVLKWLYIYVCKVSDGSKNKYFYNMHTFDKKGL